MTNTRTVRRLALLLTVLVTTTVLGSATANAAELGDYRWERRPLLLFAPSAADARVVETVGRIEAGRCDFVSRDMVLGLVMADGDSTLDGHALDAAESRRLVSRFAIDEDRFTTLLIGKDGGEKLRVDGVPDLQAIYALIDGMPMRSNEVAADPGRC